MPRKRNSSKSLTVPVKFTGKITLSSSEAKKLLGGKAAKVMGSGKTSKNSTRKRSKTRRGRRKRSNSFDLDVVEIEDVD